MSELSSGFISTFLNHRNETTRNASLNSRPFQMQITEKS